MAKLLRASTKPDERGASLILLTFMCITVVIPMVGLAIDGSMMFWIKAKLSAAADAAALAGARSLSVTGTFATRQSVGTATADQYFAANYPPGFLGTTVIGGTPTVTVTQSSSAVLTVNVAATVNAPLYFMRILGFQSVPISAIATSARRNVNVLLVLDRSGSMSVNSTCSTMVADAQLFTSYFTDGFDTLGLITFSTSANLDYNPSLYFKSGNPTINSQIAKITCSGATSATQGLQLAYSQIQALNQTGSLNVIVFFTDGQPNVVTSDAWPVKTQADTRYSYSSTSTLTSVAKSSCSSSLTTLSGGMTTLLAAGTSPAVNGYTGGLFSYAGVPITSPGNTTPISYSGCSFSSQSNGITVRNDVAYIPDTDKWGYPTTGYKSVDRFPTGYTYAGYIRDDEQTTGVIAAAFNTADNLGSIIRYNSSYSTIIYTIGLGGAADAVDQTFLQRLANDPQSPIFDSTIPAGKFAYAPTAAQLGDAFRQIASQILRLSM